MEDFNNIEHDSIPEGLEFNESYMQEAFAMYDAEKEKRKRRLLIWWITSAVGFAAVILTGVYFYFSSPSQSKSPLLTTSTSTHSDKYSKDHNSVAEKEKKQEKTFNQTVNTTQSVNRVNTTSKIENYKGEIKHQKRSKNKSERKAKLSHTNKILTKEEKSTNDLLVEIDSTTILDLSSLKNNVTPANEIGQAMGDSLLHKNLQIIQLKPSQLTIMKDTDEISTENHPHEEIKDFRNHHIFLNLGVNTLFGMKELKDRVTFRESIGVSYNYQIRPKWSFGAGLEYHSISRISYKRKVGDTLNSDNTTTILNKTTLNYISLFPEVRYQLAAKHQFTAGLGLEYLLTDPGERYEIQNYTSEENARTNSKLYYSTFQRINFSASIGYSYQFSRFMSAHALYHFGFTDITKNTNLSNSLDRNSRLQLMLKIKLY